MLASGVSTGLITLMSTLVGLKYVHIVLLVNMLGYEMQISINKVGVFKHTAPCDHDLCPFEWKAICPKVIVTKGIEDMGNCAWAVSFENNAWRNIVSLYRKGKK